MYEFWKHLTKMWMADYEIKKAKFAFVKLKEVSIDEFEFRIYCFLTLRCFNDFLVYVNTNEFLVFTMFGSD